MRASAPALSATCSFQNGVEVPIPTVEEEVRRMTSVRVPLWRVERKRSPAPKRYDSLRIEAMAPVVVAAEEVAEVARKAMRVPEEVAADVFVRKSESACAPEEVAETSSRAWGAAVERPTLLNESTMKEVAEDEPIAKATDPAAAWRPRVEKGEVEPTPTLEAKVLETVVEVATT